MEAPPRSAEAATAVAISEAVHSIAPRSGPMESSGVESRRIQPAKKLRLTCSYGGHIVLRPHDKSLCYVGGETRIVLIDRHASLADLLQRLSRNFMPNESFFLKYQLPSEDLDSLISVATEEDLENMVEEYDRITHGIGGVKLDRLRIFLFPKSASRLQQLLFQTESIKTEDYFFSALNGRTTGVLSLDADRDRDRELNESSSVNSLLGLHDDCVDNAAPAEKDANFQSEAATEIDRNPDDGNCIVRDSPFAETPPCFGSSVPTNSPAVKDSQNAGLLGMEEEPVMLLEPSKTQISSISSEINAGDQNNSQILDPGYVISGHPLHQMPHFYQSNSQFIPSAGPVPMASYYPVYPSVQQQHHHPPQQIYLVPARQNQTYSQPPLQQSSYSEVATSSSSSSQKEMADGMYRTVSGGGQARYVGFNQVYHRPSDSMPHPQMYLPPQMPSPQFHTLGIQQLAKSTERDYTC